MKPCPLKNLYEIKGDVTELYVVSKEQLYKVLINTSDLDLVLAVNSLYISKNHVKTPYVKCHKEGKDIYLHRLLLNAKKGFVIDHINHDVLDNRRSNLREVKHVENMRNRKLNKNNSLGACGVTKYYRKYRARISVNGKYVHLGLFETIEKAKNAVEEAKKIYWKKVI